MSGDARMEPSETPESGRPAVRVLHSLLRCTRPDERAGRLFSRIDSVPGLWVLELASGPDRSWPAWLADTRDFIAQHRAWLATLGPGGSDYTLHVTLDDPPEHLPVLLPPAFMALLSSIGIHLELCRQTR